MIRSKQNLRDCTRVGIGRREKRASIPIPEEVVSLCRQMAQVGIVVECDFPNFSYVKGGPPVFFEVIDVNARLLMEWCFQHSSDKRVPRVTQLVELLCIERSLDPVTFVLFFEEPTERCAVLRRHEATRMEDYYSQAIGKEIRIKPFFSI